MGEPVGQTSSAITTETITLVQAEHYARAAGVPCGATDPGSGHHRVAVAGAVAMAESGLCTSAIGGGGMGLWQIQTGGTVIGTCTPNTDDMEVLCGDAVPNVSCPGGNWTDPSVNAGWMATMSSDGSNWEPWCTYGTCCETGCSSPPYLRYIDAAETAYESVCSGGGGGGGGATSCKLAGHTYSQNTCTETKQCNDGAWVARSSDPSSCNVGVKPDGKCITDSGSVVAQNTCTSTLQCDDGVWVDRVDDSSSCLGSSKSPSPTPTPSPSPTPSSEVVGMAGAPKGYWDVTSSGKVIAHEGAGAFGDASGETLTSPIVGMAATPTGAGYWLAGAAGEVYDYGDAKFYGSMAGKKLNKAVVGIATTPDGSGYWLVAADGGVFSFGEAGFQGSLGDKVLSAPIVGMAAMPWGSGYLLLGSDGSVFAFGDAAKYGSRKGKSNLAPFVAIASTSSGDGYWLLDADGGVFTFGDAKSYGSLGTTQPSPIVGFVVTPDYEGYWIEGAAGTVSDFGDAH
jgi:hypothetical protein